ncbi:hypothetical protein GLOIN_2v1886697 [Rhizophagus irregularis DAOM 181602=DAOM 197198]|nr:hypothetical protein GLOIN_2v1886697 [Rhizophagus irregularis DAOM 181602=DAOM 197198]
MSYFPRADDFAPAPGYDHTPAGPDDFIFNHDTTRTVPPTEDSLSDTPSFHNDFEDIRPFSSPNKNYIFSTKYEKFHVTPHHRAGISFTTSYHAYNTNVVATKKLDFIYSKKYGNLQFTPSLSPKVKKRQEARFNASKKFIEPSKGYYTFPISFPETKTVPAPAIAETICNVSSVASISNGNPISSVNTDNWENIPEHYIPLIPQSAIYEGGRLNQPSRMKIWKKNLQPLAVGSDGWLAHMKEIYDHHGTMTKYEQERIIAKIQWDTTPTKANTERIYAIL